MRYVTIEHFATQSGYTPAGVRAKIYRGQWVPGIHFQKAPDGRILIDLEAYEQWVQQRPPKGSKSGATASASRSNTRIRGAGKP